MPTSCAVFTATYLVNRGIPKPDAIGPVAQAFFAAREKTGDKAFPFDGADDPSFFCAQHLERPVTWGVCRTDVRNQVKPGDWVAFFSGERADGSNDFEYRFVAALKVAGRHSGWAVPEQFRDYLNLLAAQESADGTLHQAEPALARKAWHNDWLWRLSASPQGRKPLFEQDGKAGSVHAGYPKTADADGKNYIEFEQQAGFVLERPPVVATRVGKGKQEEWLQEAEVLRLRDAVFGKRDGHYLRTTNEQQPHRHTRRAIQDGEAWIAGIQAAARAFT